MIRNNYPIKSYEVNDIHRARDLQDKGILKIIERKYVVCPRANCKKQNQYVESSIHEIDCQGCRSPFVPRAINIDYITVIDEKGTFQFLLNLLREQNPILNQEENTIELNKAKKRIKLVIIDYCYNTFLFEPTVDDMVIRVVADEVKLQNQPKGVVSYKFLKLEDIIDDPTILGRALEQLDANDGISHTQEMIEKFEKFEKNLDRQGKNLEILTERLCKYIQENKEKVNKFMIALERDKNTIWGSKIFRMAGPSQPDLMHISLYGYLMEFLQSDKDFECKSWPNSTISLNDLGADFGHAIKNNRKGIIEITIAKKISPELWETARKAESLKLILIDKYILMRILSGIDAWKLLD